MCGWGPYARETSVWEACCRYSGVINMFLNCPSSTDAGREVYNPESKNEFAGLVRARAGGLSAARTRGGCGRGQVAYRQLGHVGGRGRGKVAYRRLGHARGHGRGQVAYRRLGHVATLLESFVTRLYDAAIGYNF